jgi:lipopolysaccharide export system permease protein
MRILERNPILRDLLFRHTGPFLFCFFSIMFILLMQFLILHADKIIGKGLPVMVVLELILTNLAYMVVMAVPMAVLVASLIAYGRFSEWNEWTALRAAGVHPWRVITPMLLIALLMSVGLMLFSTQVLPRSNQKARSLFIDIRMKKPGFDLKEGAFYDGIEGYTFLVRTIDTDTDSLYNVFLYQRESQERYRAAIRAERGFIRSEGRDMLTLMLHEGTLVQFLPQGNMEAERVENSSFSTYRITFDLSELAFTRSNPDQRSLNDRTMTPAAMSAVIDTLQRQIEEERSQVAERSGAFLRTLAPRQWDTRDGDFTGTAGGEAAQAPLQAFDSRWPSLSAIADPVEQNKALNRLVSSLEQYRMTLDNAHSSMLKKQQRIASYEVEIHKKMSIPLACVIFLMIGAPIGLMTRKGNIGWAAVISSALLTLYFLGVIQGEKLADRLIISPWWGMWGVDLVFAAVGVVLLWKVRQPMGRSGNPRSTHTAA